MDFKDLSKEQLIQELEELQRENRALKLADKKGPDKRISAENAENEIHETKGHFELIFNTSPDCALLTRLSDGIVVEVNEGFTKLTGFSREDAIGKSSVDLNLWKNPSDRQKIVDELTRQGFSDNLEAVFLRKDGSTLLGLMSAKVILLQGIPHIISVTRDITERKATEQNLEQSRAELKAIYDFSPIMMCLIDSNRQILFANPAFTSLTGTSEELLKGGHACGVFGCINAFDDVQGCGFGANCPNCSLRLAMDDTLQNGTGHINVEYHTTLLRNGVTREVSFLGSTALIERNDQRNLLLCLHDITNHTLMEEALHKSERKLQTMLQTMVEAMVTIDLSGEITYCNPAAEQILDMSKTVLGKYFQSREWNQIDEQGNPYPPEQLPLAIVLREQRTVSNFEHALISSNGERKWLSVNAAPLHDSNGQLIGGIASFRDITERKQAEKVLKESEEKYRLLTEFTADVIWVLNLTTGKFTYVSPSVFHLRGVTAEEAMLESMEDSLTPDSVSAVKDAVAKNTLNFIAHPEIPNYYINEVQQYCKNGEAIWVEVSTQFRYNSTGDIEVVGVSRNIEERKKIEETLRKNEQMLRETGRIAKLGGWEIDLATSKLTWSEETYRIHEVEMHTPQELQDGINFYAPEAHPVLEKAINLAMTEGVPFDLELPLITAKGNHLWVRSIGNADLIDGKPVRLYGVFQDITERKRAEVALMESERTLNEAQRISQIGSFVTDIRAGTWEGSETLYDIFGIDSSFIRNIENWGKLMAPGFNQEMVDYYYTVIKERTKFDKDYKIIRPIDGQIRWVSAQGEFTYDAEGNPIIQKGTIQDITERKNAEEALQKTNAYLENLINYANAPIIVWDPQFRITRFNHAFEHLTGLAEKEVLGKSLKILFPPALAENSMQLIRNTLTGERWEIVEIQIQHIDNSVRTVLWNSATILAPDGKTPIATIAQGQDITERKNTEALLLKAKQDAEIANKAKSIFLANMSHEIRTPLNAILGFSQLMNRDKALSDTQNEYSASIIRAGDHLLMLINDILELSKVEAGRVVLNPVSVDLLTLFNDLRLIFKEKAHSKHLGFTFETAVNLPRFVVVDESKLRQIFINLIGNALKFTDEGSITVRTRFDKNTDGTGYLFVEIEDTGVGIAEDELSKLFIHFTQTSTGIKKGSGTGLGLALSRELALLMGGNIIVASELGKGSVFTFYVEIKEGSVEAIDPNGAKRVICLDKGQKTYRILVVDDRNENLQVVVTLLQMVGFETNKAVNGKEAIELFEKWNPDLILMDLRMPVMDGYEATRLIKATDKGSRTPIVALTASTLEGDKKRIETMDIQGYICKPFRENELFGTIGRILDVQYVYDDERPSSQEIYLNDEEVIAEAIGKLQDSLRLKMMDALAVADMKELKNLIGSIGQENSELAHHLIMLARNYDYEHLQRLLSKNHGNC